MDDHAGGNNDSGGPPLEDDIDILTLVVTNLQIGIGGDKLSHWHWR